MASAGPSEGFLSRAFGKKKMSGVSSGSSSTAKEPYKRTKRDEEVSAEGKSYEGSRASKNDDEDDGGIFSSVRKMKKKYNPFDRFVEATKGK